MHILTLIGIGLVVLAAFILVARSLNRAGRAVDGALPFIWVWLIASTANGAVGVSLAGRGTLRAVIKPMLNSADNTASR